MEFYILVIGLAICSSTRTAVKKTIHSPSVAIPKVELLLL